MSFCPGKIFNFVPGNGARNVGDEVTPGLLAGAEPDAHQFLCHDLINGGGRMERDPGKQH
jgi:hypothetical protein